MRSFLFKGLLTERGWKENAAVHVDDKGIITAVDAAPKHTGTEFVNGYAIPGFQNAHSHAFQYAMAGLAERHDGNGTPDDFWSWRDAMYRLALSVNPDQLEAIAAMLYAEMVRHGYTRVAEFHYVHHDKNGKPYANLAEMGSRLVAAARKTGLNITLIPILYRKGGFGIPPTEAQRRFISATLDDYRKLYDASEKATHHYSGANIAVGVHSMRAADPDVIKRVAEEFPQDVPFHIHIAEQLKEIRDALAYLKQRPVEWMLDHIAMSDRFHLVHATHLTENEAIGIARSGANVVLCPSTEGNLGDGIFPLALYQQHGGQWSIGTDSHIGLNPLEELRILDYGQRLSTHKRNSYYLPDQGDSGSFGIAMALRTGRKAMNDRNEAYFKVGQPLDAVVYDANTPLLACTSPEYRSSTLVYATDARMHRGTLINGVLMASR
ncbi:MAG: formimidoylglutamate deiminase, partial [Sinomicrobium sp.]|nr:formimidoylglutamate deiminase [Sinomicrobium sp.]